MKLDNYTIALFGVLLVGLVTMVAAFRQMKPGFGIFNLRVVGIILVATFVTVLGIIDNTKMTAAVGILGAIAGYLFGANDQKSDRPQ